MFFIVFTDCKVLGLAHCLTSKHDVGPFYLVHKKKKNIIETHDAALARAHDEE